MHPTPIATSAAAVARRRDQHIAAGIDLMHERRYADAFAEFERARELDPGDVRPLVNLGVARQMTGWFHEAIYYCDRALAIDPACAEAIENRGVARKSLGDLDGALADQREAARLRPDNVRILTNLAGTLEAAYRPEEAIEVFSAALAIDPDDRESYIGRGINRLATGDLGGMADLDRRLDRPQHLITEVPGVPRWTGEDLGDRTLIVNQYLDGFGDCIQGIRSAPAARARCGRLIVACAEPMARLMRSAPGVDGVIVTEDDLRPILPDIAAQCPPLGLPWYCGLSAVAEIPGLAEVPYLAADPERVAYWWDRIRYKRRFNIGVIWQGSPSHANDAARSFRLEHLAPVERVPGVDLWSLQKGKGVEQLGDVNFIAPDLNDDPAYRDGDLAEVAAAMSALDLIVSADTGFAHLAAAIGRPTWLALPWAAEWRWLRGRDDTPWYPSVRLFRQSRAGDWRGVFDRMADELRTMIG